MKAKKVGYWYPVAYFFSSVFHVKQLKIGFVYWQLLPMAYPMTKNWQQKSRHGGGFCGVSCLEFRTYFDFFNVAAS